MSIVIKTYTTKPAEVHAVQITEENMIEVAKWCQGKLASEENPKDATHVSQFIRLENSLITSKRHAKGYVDDWVVKKGNSFRIFTPSNFNRDFETFVVPDEDDENSIYAQMVADRSSTPARARQTIIDMASRTGAVPVVKVVTES